LLSCPSIDHEASPELSVDSAALERLDASLKVDIGKYEEAARLAEGRVEELEREISGAPEAKPETKGTPRTGPSTGQRLGLRQHESRAKETLATLKATADLRQEDLNRMPIMDHLDRDIDKADETLREARKALESAKLTEGEETIRERLNVADEGLRALNLRISETDNSFHQIKGALRLTEGLHQKRAALAARVEELTHQTERQVLEAEAFDRLVALFEECREKQLNAVMAPIHDRVMRWMRLVRIGGYQSIRFTDQFLPEALVSRDGTAELTLDEESTGTIEQLALMVRLAAR